MIRPELGREGDQDGRSACSIRRAAPGSHRRGEEPLGGERGGEARASPPPPAPSGPSPPRSDPGAARPLLPAPPPPWPPAPPLSGRVLALSAHDAPGHHQPA